MTYRMKFSIAMICALAILAGLALCESRAFAGIGEVGDRDKTGTTGVQEK